MGFVRSANVALRLETATELQATDVSFPWLPTPAIAAAAGTLVRPMRLSVSPVVALVVHPPKGSVQRRDVPLVMEPALASMETPTIVVLADMPVL
jgi:hypothetical protein